MNLKYINLSIKAIKGYSQYFSEGSWSDKLRKAKDLLGENVLLPMIRLYFIMKSPDTPTSKKIFIAGALGYFILPFDIIPDFIGPIIGFTDDLAVATLILRMVDKYTTPEIEIQARSFYEHLCPARRYKIKRWKGSL